MADFLKKSGAVKRYINGNINKIREQAMTLMDAKIAKIYQITDVAGEGNERRRLLDMGFTPKCKIYIESIAPLGGTILVALRGFKVALRESAAQRISIEAVCK